MPDRLEARVAGALREAGGSSPSPAEVAAARRSLVGELQRRRARRRRAGTAVAVVLAVAGAGSWVAVGTRPHSSATSASSASSASGLPGRTTTTPRESCAQVVGSARCVGAVAPSVGAGSAARPSAVGAEGTSSPYSTARPSGQSLVLGAGRSLTLVLPAVTGGAAWGGVHVAGGAQPVGARPVVRLAPVEPARNGRAATVIVTGIRAGSATVSAVATCPTGRRDGASGQCSPEQWTVQVEVSS